MTTREELVNNARRPKWGPGNRPFYDKASAALEAAHTACLEKHTDALGMSHGPFSGVNEALGIIASLEEKNQIMRHALRLAYRQEASVEELARLIDPIAFNVNPSMYGLRLQDELESRTLVGGVRGVARDKARALLAKYSITKREG